MNNWGFRAGNNCTGPISTVPAQKRRRWFNKFLTKYLGSLQKFCPDSWHAGCSRKKRRTRTDRQEWGWN